MGLVGVAEGVMEPPFQSPIIQTIPESAAVGVKLTVLVELGLAVLALFPTPPELCQTHTHAFQVEVPLDNVPVTALDPELAAVAV